MPSHTEQQLLPYDAMQLYDLVMDVARYPEFLPWCRASRIVEQGSNKNEFLAELIIEFKHLTESYTSKVVGVPGTSVDVVMVKGPFEYLTNKWKFTTVASGTMVDFALDFKFRSRILEMMIGPIFKNATAEMITAFKVRANALYGVKV